MRYRLNIRFMGRTIIVLLILICTLALAWLALRNYVLHKVIDSVEARFRTKYKSELTIKENSFTGFARLSLIGITLAPENMDTLFEADTLVVDPSLLALLTGHIKLVSIEATYMRVNLVKNDSITNYRIFFHSKNDSAHVNTATRDYSAFANNLLNNFFYYLPVNMDIRHLEVSTQVNEKKELAAISLSKHNEKIGGSLEDLTQHKTWNMEGTVNKGTKTFACKLYGTDEKEVRSLPFMEAFTDAQLYFNTFFFSLDINKFSRDVLSLSGKISADDLRIHHDKISKDEVLFNQLSYDYHFTVSNHAVVADSVGTLQINNLTAKYGFSFSNDDHKEYGIDFNTDFVPANDFFASLPQGMFNNFDQMKAEGQLQYLFHFRFNSEMPNSLEFESSLKKEGFHILKYGVTNFAMLNGDFIYTAYENDKPFRTINVSPSNPDFVPLQNIPACFKNAVLTSEDGSFFFHNGFNESAFKKSIAANYEAGKFVRGGSTITMQLVKNVFLSRHKTIARKAEEALIVWLIENNHIVSKERMLEVYLNIIELGPNVYGLNEAAHFYFNKTASELTLPESIFLASLLPRPKWFKYSFDKDGSLKPYFADYFRVVSNFLLKKNLITQEEYDHLKPEITLKWPAKNVVMPVDSLPPLNEDEE